MVQGIGPVSHADFKKGNIVRSGFLKLQLKALELNTLANPNE